MERLFNTQKDGLWGDKENELQKEIEKPIRDFIKAHEDINPCDLGQLINTIVLTEVSFATYKGLK